MNLADTIGRLLRRWYIIIPGAILAIAVAFGAWSYVKPEYQRTATQLLLPGAENMPKGANPYLYLGGLTEARDVLVRSLSADNVLGKILRENPGAKAEIAQDYTTTGPLVVITVTATSDAQAKTVLTSIVDSSTTVLEDLQAKDNIEGANRIKVMSLTVDDQSTLVQRTRIIIAGGGGAAVLVLSLMAAAVVDGVGARGNRGERRGPKAVEPAEADAEAKLLVELDPEHELRGRERVGGRS